MFKNLALDKDFACAMFVVGSAVLHFVNLLKG